MDEVSQQIVRYLPFKEWKLYNDKWDTGEK